MIRKKKRDQRRGATTVEFAISASILVFVLFAFFEFGMVMMIESFAENAAFRSARHAAVLGASVEEAVELARSDMEILGVDDAEIIVEPTAGSQIQGSIDSNTESIRVRVRVPLANHIAFGRLFSGTTMERQAVIITERSE